MICRSKTQLLKSVLFFLITVVLLLTACQPVPPPEPTEIPSPVPITTPAPTITPALTPTPDDGWDIIPNGSHLENDLIESCMPGSQITDTGLEYAPSNQKNPNLFNTHLAIQGDFGLYLKLEVTPVQYAGITLYDQFPWSFVVSNFRRSWDNGFKHMNILIKPEGVGVDIYDGKQKDPIQSYTFTSTFSSPLIELKIRRIGNELVLLQGMTEIGRFAEDDFFSNNVVYYGLTASNQDKLILHELSAQVPRGQEKTVNVVSFFDSVMPNSNLESLKALAQPKGLWMGTEFLLDTYLQDPQYAAALTQLYDLWDISLGLQTTHPAQDQYDFCTGDLAVQLASANGAQVKADHLIWEGQMSEWLARPGATAADIAANKYINFNLDQWPTLMVDYIRTVVGHYKGKIKIWSVVNEAIRDPGETAQVAPGDLRDTQWLGGVGPNYIDLAFQTARAADPDALLFYNDYNAEGMGQKANAVFDLVKDLVTRGIPIDGVGLQMHLQLQNHPSVEDIAANIQRLTALGLKVQITEMDITIKGAPGTWDQRLAEQAQLYQDILKVCLANKDCQAFTTWGFTDKYSWKTGYMPATDESPLILDQNYQPKPAFKAIVEALKE